MKDKKGFIFVETIVVLVVVVFSLTLILASYSLVTRKSKMKYYYDQVEDIYLLYVIANLGNATSTAYTSGDTFIANKNTCNTYMSENFETCSQVFSDRDLGVEYFGYIKSVSAILSNPTSYDNGIIEYVKQLKNNEKYHYLILVRYKNNEYYYSSILIKDGEVE